MLKGICQEFVKRVFTYLYLSQGLSESELLEIISIDEEFISKIAPETYHNNDTKELYVEYKTQKRVHGGGWGL